MQSKRFNQYMYPGDIHQTQDVRDIVTYCNRLPVFHRGPIPEIKLDS